MRFRHTFILAVGFILLATAQTDADDRVWVEQIRVNGNPVRMFFDSAADGVALTSDAVKRLGLKVADPPKNGLPGDTAVYTLDLGGNRFQTGFGILNVPVYGELDFDWFVGWPNLNSNIFRIDAASRQITFLKSVPSTARNWSKFLIATNSGLLDLEVQHNDGTKGIITVDTGNWFGIGLSPRLWRQWKDAHPHTPMTLRTCITPHGFAVAEEAFADKIYIGPLQVSNVPVLKLDRNGVIAPKRDNQDAVLALAALSRLDFVVDGPHNLAYLRAKRTSHSSYTYNRLGAVFVATTEHPRQGVAMVVDGSPAYDAGIRDGDILLEVEGIRVDGWTDDWLSKFELPAGTKLQFLLLRNGTNFETTAVLRGILDPGRKPGGPPPDGESAAEAGAIAKHGGNAATDASQIAQKYYTVGTNELLNGSMDVALTNFSKAIETKPDFPEAYAGRGYAKQMRGEIDSAILDYNKSLELKPDYAVVYCDLGSAKQAKGDTTGALAEYSKAIEIEPNLAEAHAYRGQIEESQGNQDEALADYTKAIELKLNWPQIFFYRGSLEHAKGDISAALADYDRAIELKPDWGLAYGHRAEAEASAGDLSRAEADSAEAAKLDKSLETNAAVAIHFFAWRRYQRQEYTNALSDFRMAGELNSSDDYARFGVWLCSSLLRNSGEATKELRAHIDTRSTVGSDDWPGEVGRFLADQITEQDLVKAAQDSNSEIDKEKHGEAYFYIGSKRLIAGDKAGAAASFKKALAAGTQGFQEYKCAKAELEFLENTNRP